MRRSPARIATATALAALAAPYVWASAHHVLVLLIDWGDGWAHLGAIRRTVERGAFPGDVFYAGEPTPPYYSLAHVVFALLSTVSGAAPHELLAGLPPVIVVLVIGAVFQWLRTLSGDVRVALAGAAVELLVSLPGPRWQSMTFPRSIALLPLYLAWWAYVRGRRGGGIGWIIAAGVLLGVCLATHLFTGGLCLAGIVVHEWAVRGDRPRSLARPLLAAACGLVVAAPWLASFAVAATGAPEAVHFSFRLSGAVVAPFAAAPWIRVLRPGDALAAWPAALWAPAGLGLLAAVARTWRRTATDGDRYALLSLGLAALVVFTPIFSLTVAALGVWAPRLLLLAPLSLAFGLGTAALFGNPGSSLARQVGAAAVMVAVGLGAWGSVRGTALDRREYGAALRRGGPLGTWALEAELARRGVEPGVVLTDPQTAYLLPYLLGAYVVAAPAAHGSPYVDHASRERDARAFMGGSLPFPRMSEILDRYGVDTVAVSRLSSWPLENSSSVLLERLRRWPAVEDAGCCSSVAFFRRRRPEEGSDGR